MSKNSQFNFTDNSSTNVPLNFPSDQIYYQTPASKVNNTNSNSNTQQVSDQSIGIGSIIAHSSNVIPAGYLLCNGAQFSAVQYPLLYASLGNSNTLPDMRGMFARGLDTTGTVDNSTNRQLLSFEEGSLLIKDGDHNDVCGFFQNQTGTQNTTGTNSALGWDNVASNNTASNTYSYPGTVGNDSRPLTNTTFFGVSRPKNVAVNYIIKAAYVGSVISATALSNYVSGAGGNITGSLSINGNQVPQVLNSTNATGNPVIQSFPIIGTFNGNNYTVTFPQAFATSCIPQVYVQTNTQPGAEFRVASILNTDSTAQNLALTNTGFTFFPLWHYADGGYGSTTGFHYFVLAIGYM